MNMTHKAISLVMTSVLGIGALVVVLGCLWDERAWATTLEDVLLENQKITIDQWIKLKAEEEKRHEKELEASRAAGDTPVRERWWEKISIRGYTQVRYTYLIDNDFLRIDQDRSIDETNQFFIRRARLIFSGQPHERVFFYFQPEFAGLIGTVEQAGVVRDLYADLFLTENKEWRIRVGLSKVPFGFENMQSSQNRLAFDRNDALQSGTPTERDLGLFVYYTPTSVRERFRRLVDSGLKGSGDYGMVGIGVYNGQGVNVRDTNKNKHVVVHAMYPHEFANGQILQVGMSAYTGRYHVSTTPVVPLNPAPASQGAPLTPIVENGGNYLDQRVAWHVALFPQPFGLQGEYTIGRGPELNPERTRITTGNIRGGYIQAFYRYRCDDFCESIIPYVRLQEYFGGKKVQANAPRNTVREAELGVELRINKALELTVAYAWSQRTSPESETLPASCADPSVVGITCAQTPYRLQSGDQLRFQLQWNF